MTKDDIIKLRALVQGQLIRTYHLALELHKQEEHLENIISALDAHILQEEQK